MIEIAVWSLVAAHVVLVAVVVWYAIEVRRKVRPMAPPLHRCPFCLATMRVSTDGASSITIGGSVPR